MTGAERSALVEAVRTNCAIADARHAADMTLCTYLLQMRELHRWERALPFGATLDRQQVGDWIAEREQWWSELEDREFVRLPLAGTAERADPFEVETINRQLHRAGLLYGAGLVGAGRPVFFLAELHGQDLREGIPVSIAGRELARGLIAPPAVSAGCPGGTPAATIVVRRESLARWCWEKFEAYGLRRTEGSAFHEVVRAYALESDFTAALPRLLDEQSEMLVLHELGEHHAGQRLDPDWAAMLLALPGRRAALYARAVRDHLADLELTLPTLLDRGADASIHFWFANYDGIREALYPALRDTYDDWQRGDGDRSLRRAAQRGAAHFDRLAAGMLARFRHGGSAAAADIERLLTAAEAVCAD